MIGIFDSGVGGLTVVKEIFKQLPGYQTIYFGDTARLPYGTKGADFVKKYSKKITEWLLAKGVKIIVVACNTSSALAGDYLKKEFPGVPIFEMIEPAIKDALRMVSPAGKGKIGIIGTPGTIKSNIYNKKLLADARRPQVYQVACPLLVPLVEEGLVDDKITEEILKRYLKPLKAENIETLVLGCTHYPLLESMVKKIMGKNARIINPAEALAQNLKEFLKNNSATEKKMKKGVRHQFFFSDEPYNLAKISRLCFNKKIKPIIKDPF